MPSLAELDELVFGGPQGSATPVLSPSPLGQATRGRKSKPLDIATIRDLTAQEVSQLPDLAPLVAYPSIKLPSDLKHSHHQLARLLALGKEIVDVSYITGYSCGYIQEIRKGRDFAELETYYSTQREQMFIDTLERMKVAGICSLDKLMAKLEDEGEVWSKRELMDMTELLLVKSQNPTRGNAFPGNSGVGPAGNGVNINVSFVTAPGQSSSILGQVIELVPEFKP